MRGSKHYLLQHCGKEREANSRNEFSCYKHFFKENEAKDGQVIGKHGLQR